MLNIEIKNLMSEVRAARKWLAPYLKKRAEIINALAGPHYRDCEGAPQPENYPFTWSQYIKPQLLFGRPVVNVTANSVQNKDCADGLKAIQAHWSKETSQKAVLSEVLDDALVAFGVTKTCVAPRGHYEGRGLQAVEGDFEQVPNYPCRVNVDVRYFIVDPRAKKLRQARFIGHSYERDLEDVQKDWRFDSEAVAGLTTLGREEAPEEHSPFPSDNAARHNDPDRKRVTLIELYLPEYGTLMTIAEMGVEHGVVLRDEPYFGPDEGPFCLWGLASVPGELIPISPVQALWDQYQALLTHSNHAAESADTHKQLGVYDKGQKEDGETCQNAKNGQMVGVTGGKQTVGNLEIGGVSEGQISWVEYLRVHLEQGLAYGQAQQGVAGKETATGEQIAATNSDLRVDAMRDRVADSLVSDARKVNWYFFHDESIGRVEMTHTDPNTGEQKAATFVAGPWQGGFVDNRWIPPETPSDYDDYHYEVDVSTLTKTDDAVEQKRGQDFMVLAVQMAGIFGPQMINWRGALDFYGEKTLGMKEMSKRLLLDQTGMFIPPDVLANGMAMRQFGPEPGMKPQPGAGRMGGGGAAGAASLKPSFGGGPGGGMTALPDLMADARGGTGY